MSLFPVVRYAEKKDGKDQITHKHILEKVKANSQKRASKFKRAAEILPINPPPPSKTPKKTVSVPTPTKRKKVAEGEACAHSNEHSDLTIGNARADSVKISEGETPKRVNDEKNEGSANQKKQTRKKNESLNEDSESESDVWNKPYDPLKEFKSEMKRQKGMLVIGGDVECDKRVVKQKLPEWLENPGYISSDMLGNEESDSCLECLDERLQSNLKRMGITKLFPVQRSIIPPLLFDTKFGLEKSVRRPNDICVCSPTGSGKTMAFALPVVNALLCCNEPATRVLVVLPTVELAKQVQQVFFSLTKGCRINCALLGGSKTLLEETRSLNRIGRYGEKIPPDVIVATPGRLVHYLETSRDMDLGKLRFLVIDEADRILDHIKQSWIQKLDQCLEKEKTCFESKVTLRELWKPVIPVQKLLFSATLSTDPEKLEVLNLFQPRLYKPTPDVQRRSSMHKGAAKYLTPAALSERRVHCSTAQKPLLVINLIKQNHKKTLVFVGSTESAHRLSLVLQEFAKAEEDGGVPSFSSTEFSSLLNKKERKRRLSQFKSGSTNVLVCSDAAARGLDVEDVDQVILYDSPRYLETYIHRIGRTSRAGKAGTGYTLVCTTEIRNFKRLFRDGGRTLPQKLNVEYDSMFTKMYETALGKVQSALSSESAKSTT